MLRKQPSPAPPTTACANSHEDSTLDSCSQIQPQVGLPASWGLMLRVPAGLRESLQREEPTGPRTLTLCLCCHPTLSSGHLHFNASPPTHMETSTTHFPASKLPEDWLSCGRHGQIPSHILAQFPLIVKTHWTKCVHEHPAQREKHHGRRRATQTSCTFATAAMKCKEVSQYLHSGSGIPTQADKRPFTPSISSIS